MYETWPLIDAGIVKDAFLAVTWVLAATTMVEAVWKLSLLSHHSCAASVPVFDVSKRTL
jgi:hypothetical protein